MSYLKKLYLNIEGFGVSRPVATSIILTVMLPILAAFFPELGFKQQLFKQYSVSGFIILAAALSMIHLTAKVVIYHRADANRRSLLRRIHALLKKLNAPFERESIPLGGSQPYKKKFYDYEMINSFDEYNRILLEAKSKWPNEFSTLSPLKNNKRIHPGDWIPESDLNGVKVSLIHLKELLQ